MPRKRADVSGHRDDPEIIHGVDDIQDSNESVDINSETSHPMTEGIQPRDAWDVHATPVHSSQFAGVVKVFTTMVKPNYAMPWQMRHEERATASGFMIDGRRIITNAHAVAYHSSVLVRKHGDPTKHPARVIGIGHDCDLAVLTVDDDVFWQDSSKFTLSFTDAVPELQGRVSVVGFPLGGDNLSITAGVVSRVDYQEYAHSTASLLSIQIDAAINSGNSGGPAFYNGRVAGVAFQSLEHAENIGYIIPTPIVQHFLEDVERHGKATGFGSLGIEWQSLDNKSMRKFCGMNDQNITGVLVVRIVKTIHSHEVLKPLDVICAVDGVAIASDGTIPFRDAERINFAHAVSLKFIGDRVTLDIYRNKELIKVNVELQSPPELVPPTLYERKPSYIVHGGLVFTVLSVPYLAAQWGHAWDMKAPVRLVHSACVGEVEEKGEQCIVLAHVLAHPLTVGYDTEDTYHVPLKELNGTKVKSLAHLLELIRKIEASDEEYLMFKLVSDILITLPTKEAANATREVLTRHAIPHALSDDLRIDTTKLSSADVSSNNMVPNPASQSVKQPQIQGDVSNTVTHSSKRQRQEASK